MLRKSISLVLVLLLALGVRIVRDGVIVHDGTIASMRHYRDDVTSVKAGTECGIGITDYQDVKQGDIIEGYRIEQVARKE